MSRKIYLRGFHATDGLGCTFDDVCSLIQKVHDAPDQHAKALSGFHHQIEHEQESAVFSIDQDIFFQLGDRRWNWVKDRVTIRYKISWLERLRLYFRIGNRPIVDITVTVFCRRRIVYKHKYKSSLAFHVSVNDMCFSTIDLEMEDWWLYLFRFQNDHEMRAGLVALWQEFMVEGSTQGLK